MTVAGKELSKQVLALPDEDRATLARLLIQSLDSPEEVVPPEEWSASWTTEIERRVEEIRSGKVKTVPADQVMKELRAKYA